MESEKLIEEILHRFYYVHHDQAQLKAELVSATSSVEKGFDEAKEKILSGITRRIDGLKDSYKVLANTPNYEDLFGYQNRIDELESLRNFVNRTKVRSHESKS